MNRLCMSALVLSASAASAAPCGTPSECQAACSAGNGAACGAAADAFRSGQGVAVDRAQALAYDNVACERRFAPGCTRLGRAFERGAEGLENAKRALEELGRAAQYFQKGCDAGSAEACGDLARLTLWGAGARPDAAAARALADRACQGGDGASCRFFIWFLESGVGGAKEPVRVPEVRKRIAAAMVREAPFAAPPWPGPAEPVLSVVTSPPGQDVFVDGMFAGPSPVSLPVPAGERVLEAGGRPQRVTCARGSPCSVRLEAPAMLTVEAPPGVTIRVDGAVVGTGSWSGAVTPGSHSLAGSGPGLTPLERTVTVAAGQTVRESLLLQPITGQLSLSSSPDGASVRIDGQLVGVTPWTGELKPGKHAVQVELDGHQAIQKSITVPASGFATETLTLKPVVVAFAITSKPSKATVSLDGVVVGKTPWSGMVQVGLRTLELALDGFQTVTDSTLVEKGGKQTKAFTLVEIPTQLSVTSDPEGASVEVDGSKVGVTPWTGPVKPGARQLAVLLDGYQDGVEQVTVPARALTRRTFTLEPRTAPVFIETRPQGASVEVDGIKRGLTPVTVSLLQGKHVVVLSRAGFETLRVENTVSSSKPVDWRWELTATKGLAPEALAAFPRQDAGVAVAPPPPPPVPPPAPAPAGETPPAQPLVASPGPVPADPGMTPTEAARRQLLADPKVSVEKKRAALEAIARSSGMLTDDLASVQPADHRGSLCLLFREKVYPTKLEVRVTNSYGQSVEGAVELNGELFGKLPFSSNVPACLSEVTVKVPDEDFTASRPLELKPTLKNEVDFSIPGRGSLAAFSATLDVAGSAAGWGDGPRTYPSGGVRFDYFGRVTHFTFALRATGMLSDQFAIPVVPAADLFLGFGGGFGEGLVRGRITVDVGVWNLINPTARLTASVQLFTHLVVTASADLHLFYAGVVPADARGKYRLIDYGFFFFPGGTLSVGYGW